MDVYKQVIKMLKFITNLKVKLCNFYLKHYIHYILFLTQ